MELLDGALLPQRSRCTVWRKRRGGGNAGGMCVEGGVCEVVVVRETGAVMEKLFRRGRGA